MKDTPITNGYIKTINETIYELSLFTAIHEESFMLMNPKDLIDDLQVCVKNMKSIDIDLVKAEFEATLEDYSKVFFQKKLFEFKFEQLLNWKYDYENGVKENISKFKDELNEFSVFHFTFLLDEHSIEYMRLKDLFINLSRRVTYLKHLIKTMLAHYDDLGNIYLQANSLKIIPNQEEMPSKKVKSEFCIKVKLASKKNTDFIKILSAMYDTRLFVDENGKPLTNKQKLMETFGNFLNVDFSTYSTSLSNAKDKDMETFLRPFREIEKAARRYYMEGPQKKV